MHNKKPKNTLRMVFFSLIIGLVGFCPFAHGISQSEFLSLSLGQQHSLIPVFNYSKFAKSTLSFNKGEIWDRLRKRFKLPVSKNHPTFKYQLKKISKSKAYVNELVTNASPYLFYILEEVEKRGMPSEIALLPMIESTFNPHARSSKGAAGLWQLMPGTGRIYGLKQNSWYDGRIDIVESTQAALDYLEYLHERFDGNWSLALAAYNSGEGKVERAINKNKARRKPTDFWSLSLPQQTSNFVPKLLAIATIIKTPEQYGVALPTIPNKPVFEQIDTGKPIDIAQAAQIADVPVKQIQKLNPGLHKKAMSPNGPYKLVVPAKSAAAIKQKVSKSPVSKVKTQTTTTVTTPTPKTASKSKSLGQKKTSAKVTKKTRRASKQRSGQYVVRKGDNIEKIAARHKVSVSALKKANRLPNDVVVLGKKLNIPK